MKLFITLIIELSDDAEITEADKKALFERCREVGWAETLSQARREWKPLVSVAGYSTDSITYAILNGEKRTERNTN